VVALHVMAEEVCALVDEHDNVIGPISRRELRTNKLTHRATYIFVMNPETQELYIHQRTMTKDFCPGYYDVVAGGVVQYGETYQQNAERELEEEYGLTGQEMEFLGTKFHQECNVWGGLFLVKWSGAIDDLRPQPEEVDHIELKRVDQILQEFDQGTVNYTPDSIYMLKELVDRRM
jgi:8-oxo-dGTP pyrophosphatase MutT (NUDIX family)